MKRVLFDNGTPRKVAGCLTDHTVIRARQLGWHQLKNGDLLAQAEAGGFDVLLSTDKNMQYQQNLSGRKIALIVLGQQQWPLVQLYLDRVAAAVNAAQPGSYTEVEIPFKP